MHLIDCNLGHILEDEAAVLLEQDFSVSHHSLNPCRYVIVNPCYCVICDVIVVSLSVKHGVISQTNAVHLVSRLTAQSSSLLQARNSGSKF